MVGTGGKKKRIILENHYTQGQSRHKIYSRLRVHEKYIIFHIKNWFLDFIKLGSENHIFPKWPHQNTSFPKRKGK